MDFRPQGYGEEPESDIFCSNLSIPARVCIQTKHPGPGFTKDLKLSRDFG